MISTRRHLEPEAPVGPSWAAERACACGAGYLDEFGVRRCGRPDRLPEARGALEFRATFLAWSGRRARGIRHWAGAGEERASYFARFRVVLRRLQSMPRRDLP